MIEKNLEKEKINTLVFLIFQIRPKKLFLADREKFGKGEDQHPWEGIFSAK